MNHSHDLSVCLSHPETDRQADRLLAVHVVTVRHMDVLISLCLSVGVADRQTDRQLIESDR